MIIIGVVGSPAGGKSTVARRLRERGATWVNADRLAKRCLDKGEVRSRLVAEFGSTLVTAAGQIDRQQLAQLVFGDDAASVRALNYLESVIHPYARHLALRRLTRASRLGIPAGVLDAPLLLEADWGVLCDYIWCVDAPRGLRHQWISQRGWTPDELRRREQRQLPIEEKRRLSTHSLVNDGTREALLRNVDQLWDQLVTESSRPMNVALVGDPDHCLAYR